MSDKKEHISKITVNMTFDQITRERGNPRFLMEFVRNGEEPFSFYLSPFQTYIVMRSLFRQEKDGSLSSFSNGELYGSRDLRFPLHQKLSSVEKARETLERTAMTYVVLVIDPWKENQQDISLSVVQAAVVIARLGIIMKNNYPGFIRNDKELLDIYGPDWKPRFYKKMQPAVTMKAGCNKSKKIAFLVIHHAGKLKVEAFKSEKNAFSRIEDFFYEALYSNDQLKGKWEELKKKFFQTKSASEPRYRFPGEEGYEQGWIGYTDIHIPSGYKGNGPLYFGYVTDAPVFREYDAPTWCIVFASALECVRDDFLKYYFLQNRAYASDPANKAKMLEADETHFVMEWMDLVCGEIHFSYGNIVPCGQ